MGLSAFRLARIGNRAHHAEAAERPPADRRAPATSRTGGKWLAGLFSIGLLAVVASPVVENWKAEPRDDFPLSYYRMFSEERADTQRLTYLVGHDARGNRYLIPYQFAGPGGMNQVRRQMNRLVEQGEGARLCQTVASRVARAGSRLPELRTVEVIVGTFRLSEYFTGQRAPLTESIRARCPVGGSRA